MKKFILVILMSISSFAFADVYIKTQIQESYQKITFEDKDYLCVQGTSYIVGCSFNTRFEPYMSYTSIDNGGSKFGMGVFLSEVAFGNFCIDSNIEVYNTSCEVRYNGILREYNVLGVSESLGCSIIKSSFRIGAMYTLIGYSHDSVKNVSACTFFNAFKSKQMSFYVTLYL